MPTPAEVPTSSFNQDVDPYKNLRAKFREWLRKTEAGEFDSFEDAIENAVNILDEWEAAHILVDKWKN